MPTSLGLSLTVPYSQGQPACGHGPPLQIPTIKGLRGTSSLPTWSTAFNLQLCVISNGYALPPVFDPIILGLLVFKIILEAYVSNCNLSVYDLTDMVG